MQNQPFEKHVWAEIDLDALRSNFRAVKARADGLPLCAVVKADSYGHGAVQCARIFAEESAAWLAVSCLAEALQLRRAGQTLPILILGHVQPQFAAELIRNDITVACYSLPQAKALSEAAAAFGCVNRVEELVKQFLRGTVAQFLARPSVSFISCSQAILGRESLNGHALRNEGSKQPVVTFVLGTFPRGVGMRKVDCTAPALDLTERRELRAVVHGNGLEDL